MRRWIGLLLVLCAGPVLADYGALVAAVNAGDAVAVRRALEEGVSSNPLVPPDPVIQAGQERPLPMYITFIWNTWPEEYYPKTPLHLAARAGNIGICRLLLDHGAEVDAQDRAANTPLCCAVAAKHEEVAVLLLERGASPEPRCHDLPMHNAAQYRLTRVLTALILRGVSPTIDDLMRVVDWGPRELVFPMIRNGISGPDHNQTETVLTMVTRIGQTEAMQWLLDHGTPTDRRNGRSETALHVACERQQVAAAKLLLDRGANPNAACDEGRVTPLRLACFRNDRALVELLLERGAIIDVHAAALLGDPTAVAGLLDRGLDVDTRGCWLQTPLMTALQAGQHRAAVLLIARGADVNARDHFWMTPLHFAAAGDDLQIINALIEAGANVNAKGRFVQYADVTPLYRAVRSGRLEIAERLVVLGASVDAVDGYGNTLLEWAAGTSPGLASLLLAYGATPTRTALCVAAAAGQLETVKALVQAGASPDATDVEGRTAAYYAQLAGHDDVVEYLRAAPHR